MKRIAVGFVLLGALAAGVSAALTPGQKLAVDALIKQFGAADFDTRQKAVDQLVGMGLDVVPVVKKAHADTQDNEVKLRCEMVLKALREKFGAAAVDGPKTANDPAVGPAKVTIHLKDADLETILQALAEKSGNKLVAPPVGEWERKPLSLDVTDASYWVALDRLCAEAKLIYVAQHADSRMGLMPLKNGRDVGAVAGPFALKIENAFRSLRVRLPDQMIYFGQLDGLTYQTSFYWEDRLQPITVEIALTSITAVDGQPVKMDEKPSIRLYVSGSPQMTMGPDALHQGSYRATGQFSFTLADAPRGAETLKSVEGVARMTFADGVRTFEIKDVLADGDKKGSSGDLTLTVQSPKKLGNFTLLPVHQSIGGKDVAPMPFHDDPRYSFTLVDPNGKSYPGTSVWITPVSKTQRFAGFNSVVKAGPGIGAVGFHQLPLVQGEWTLRCVLPETITEREWPFAIKDVPLP